MNYQAKFFTPFGMLGICCSETALCGIDFLPLSEVPMSPSTVLAREVCVQLQRYFDDPHNLFTLPLDLRGTPHQKKVWHALQGIPCGLTRHYGDLARELNSAAQAVGQACGANPIPIIVPCHRVVSKVGLGGFMRHASGGALDIKRWLLAHEQR